MSQEKPADIPRGEADPADGAPSIEDQKLHLLDLQMHQGYELEHSGLADKTRGDMMRRLREAQARIQGSAADGHGVEVDLDVDLDKENDLSRVVAALDTERNDGDVRFAGVRFMTVEVGGDGKRWQGKGFIPVAMGSLRTGWGGFIPVAGYTPEDVRVLTGLLQAVQEDKDRDILPDIDDDLATIRDPEHDPDVPAAPAVMPRF